MNRNEVKKGEHEKQVERIRYHLQRGASTEELIEMTNLNENEINSIRSKLQNKKEKEYNDFI